MPHFYEFVVKLDLMALLKFLPCCMPKQDGVEETAPAKDFTVT